MFGRVGEGFGGDAVMVTFNASVDQPDHAPGAARAALNFQDAARSSQPVISHGRGSVRGLTPVPPSPVWSEMGDNGPSHRDLTEPAMADVQPTGLPPARGGTRGLLFDKNRGNTF
jgi:hypothetical protein